MSPGLRRRLEELAAASAYAAERGLGVTALRDRRGDGELIGFTISSFPGEAPPRTWPGPVYVSIHIDVRGGRARFLEHFEREDGTHVHRGRDLPFDFSDSYRLADIWRSGPEGGEPPDWIEFSRPEPLVDFLADRLLGWRRGSP